MGGTAVSGQQRGVFDVDEDRALEALRLAWGDSYDIRSEGGQWVATSRDAEAAPSLGTPRTR